VKYLSLLALLGAVSLAAQDRPREITGWQMQDAAKVADAPAIMSSVAFHPAGWYTATVPGTVLTTLVDNKVYPEPLYGENMRLIPESLNKASYWYRASTTVPLSYQGRQVWLHFEGINYSAEIWVDGHHVGSSRGAFIRSDFDISLYARAGAKSIVAVLVSPQPHPGIPHEHTVALGTGRNGGETALDGATFLSTIGWDWIPAIRDRDTGIFLPVTTYATGPVLLKDPFVVSDLSISHESADLTITAQLENTSAKAVSGTIIGTISGQGREITFTKAVTVEANASAPISLDTASIPALHILSPKLWWPNGYGPQNLYTLKLQFDIGQQTSDAQTTSFGIRKIEYLAPDSGNLSLSVNGVRVMVRGGDWGLDEAMKRVPRERLDAQFRMHAQAHLNMIRNWVGQSTSPDFYELADKYGILLWDEFFQPNPSDGPNVADLAPYLANVTDKVLRYRNHPSIAVWCARNEGYPPAILDAKLKAAMTELDPTRLYQSSSADGRGVSSHGPYYWRSPRYFYAYNESFKTEVGSVSIPTIESIQGMMPEKDWESIDDDWAQHDMASGAQRGNEYPESLAHRYGHIRNLRDFVRQGQLANYEAFRAMYEGRNANMFKTTTGVITWMSNPAQPSFVWQLYHYDLEPNSSLFAVKAAAEMLHVQLDESNGAVEVVNNRPEALKNLKVHATIYSFDGSIAAEHEYSVPDVPGSSTIKVAQVEYPARVSAIYFVRLRLTGADNTLLSTNFYWQNVAQDDFAHLMDLPLVTLDATASLRRMEDRVFVDVTLRNSTSTIALMSHLQLRHKDSQLRVLPVFYSDNYISLVPGESRTVTIEAAAKNLLDEPLVTVDGFNVSVNPVLSPIAIRPNLNAQPLYWPATELVPERDR
jgi:beta-mannosidase